MHQFFASRFCELLKNIERERDDAGGIGWQLKDGYSRQVNRLITYMDKLEPIAKDLQLTATIDRCLNFRGSLRMADDNTPFGGGIRMTAEVIRQEIGGIMQSIELEFEDKKFAHIPTAREIYFESEEPLFGDEVSRIFPEAIDDIKAAGNCLAAELDIAAIFHLMRVSEFGLRKMPKDMRVGTKKKSEYMVWGAIISCLSKRADSWAKPSKIGAQATRKLEFYQGLIQDIKGFKDLYRNPVSHAKRSSYDTDYFSSYDPIKVFESVKGFMQKLAAGVPK